MALRPCISVFLLSALILPAAGLALEPCPPCPAGCVPLGLVQELKPEPTGRTCQEGCVPLEQVKTMADQPGCQLVTEPAPVAPPVAPAVEPTAGPAAAPAEPEPQQQNNEATRNRIVFASTAVGKPAGTLSFTGWGAGYWDITWSINDNFSVGTYFVLPVGIWGINPHASAQIAFNEYLSFGAGVLGGAFGLFADDPDELLWFIGGYVALTLQLKDFMINFNVMTATGGVRYEDGDTYNTEGVLLIPDLGFRWAFHRNWSAQLELVLPLFLYEGHTFNQGEFWLLFYGVRGHGDFMFGDIGFCLPIFDEYIDEVWKYTPIGIPYFTIGFYF